MVRGTSLLGKALILKLAAPHLGQLADGHDEQVTNFPVKLFAGWPERHRVVRVSQKRCAKLFFLVLRLSAGDGLRQVQFPGCPVETAVRGHGGKIAQLTQFHPATQRLQKV